MTAHTMRSTAARKLLSRARLARQLVQTQGTGWLGFRVAHAPRLPSGFMRWRLPATCWDEQPLADSLREPALSRPETFLDYRRDQAPPFFFAPGDRPQAGALLRSWDSDGTGPLEAMDELGRG